MELALFFIFFIKVSVSKSLYVWLEPRAVFHFLSSLSERKSVRRSTALKSQQTQSRQKRREEQAKILADIADRKNVKVEDVRRLTQEELLAEAKITEQINLKSLGEYFFPPQMLRCYPVHAFVP